MNKDLLNLSNNELTIDSREIAEMLGKEHSELLKEIEGRKDNKNVGIIPTLEKGNFHLSNYFIQSTYKAGTREYKCYLVTKLGCELLGNKQQGEKGILFTAKYVERFNVMERTIKENSILIVNKEIEELKDTVNELKKATEEVKKDYKPSHKTKLDYSKLIRTLTENEEEYQMLKESAFAVLGITKWEDTCIDDSDKIIKTIKQISKLLELKKFKQLELL
ncbi:MAG: Rha family transcriptional regulator [Clostridium sp.]|nr:Rha family transcriptional regulator [Clostridium sp.]